MSNKKKYFTFITFGQEHIHYINGETYDKDSVAVIETDSLVKGRERAFEIFGDKFCFEYPEKHWDNSKLEKYYPRGLIYINEGES